jgi:protein-disulfide isomerase
VLSVRKQDPAPPIDLPAGAAPLPSDVDTRAAFDWALAPGSPGYDRGASRASVTVLEFADFGCRYCASFTTETYPGLAATFVRTGAVRWKSVPFVLGMFPNGDAAARAAECAADQGPAAFGRLHDRLFERQDEWAGAADPAGRFRSYAAAVGLDGPRFTSCYASPAPAERIRASNGLADRMGVRATPTFFIDGERVEGALPTEQFRALLRAALRRHQGP